MWMVSDQELSGSHPKISMKDRLTYFRFLVLIIHIHICFVAIKFVKAHFICCKVIIYFADYS